MQCTIQSLHDFIVEWVIQYFQHAPTFELIAISKARATNICAQLHSTACRILCTRVYL